MSSYDLFLEALDRSFEEFVRSDLVNEYLEKIGTTIKQEALQDGNPYEFTLVTGYEDGRGHWGTAYENQIRFGKAVYSIQGLENSMVLTPNFFCGQNRSGNNLEYRMGLIKKEERVSIFPVIILRRGDGNHEAIELKDLCVVHTGILIDPESAREVGQKRINELTAFQQFITSFWNIDDYLRKQNPGFHSDFEIDGWESVEVFSGRIVNQMLREICNAFKDNPSWMIPQAEVDYWHGLVSWIKHCFNERTEISEQQILNFVKNLCIFMVNFKNYQPLEELARNDVNILPYVLLNFEGPKNDVGYEASEVFREAHKILPQYTTEYWQEFTRKIEHLLSESQDIDESEIKSIIDNLIDYMVRFNNYQPLVELTQRNINILPNILLNLEDPVKNMRTKAESVFKEAHKIMPQFVKEYWQGMLLKIEALMSDPVKTNESQIRTNLKILCTYMDKYNNYTPLEELERRGINILPYLAISFMEPHYIEPDIEKAFKNAHQQAPKLAMEYWKGLVVKIEGLMSEKKQIEENEIRSILKSLIIYMCKSENYSPLQELGTKNVKIIPYILSIFAGDDYRIHYEAERVIKVACGIIPQMIVDYWQDSISEIEKLIADANQFNQKQIKTIVRNLSIYIVKFENNKPLQELVRRKINILPYLLMNLTNPESLNVRTEVIDVFKRFTNVSYESEEDLWKQLTSKIIELVSDSSQIDKVQLISVIWNLCTYIVIFENYERPINLLEEQNIDIIPYLIKILRTQGVYPEDYGRYDPEDLYYHKAENETLVEILNVILYLGERNLYQPDIYWQERKSQIMSLIEKVKSIKGMQDIIEDLCSAMILTKDYHPLEIILQKGFSLAPHICTHSQSVYKEKQWFSRYNDLLIAYKHALLSSIKEKSSNWRIKWNDQISFLFKELLLVLNDLEFFEREETFTKLISEASDELKSYLIAGLTEFFKSELGEIALILYGSIVKSSPKSITAESVEKIIDLFTVKETSLRLKALTTYQLIFDNLPKYINSTDLNKIYELFSDPEEPESIRVAALSFYRKVFENQLPSSNQLLIIEKICRLFSNPQEPEHIRVTALSVYQKAIEKLPNLVNENILSDISQFLSRDEENLKKQAINFFKSLPHCMDLKITEKISNILSITPFISEPELEALKFLESTIRNTPEYIGPNEINRIFDLLHLHFSHNCLIEKRAMEIYRILIRTSSLNHDLTVSLILQKVSTQDWKNISIGLHAFNTYIKFTQNFSQINKVIELCTNIILNRNLKEDIRILALQSYMYFLQKNPELIDLDTIEKVSLFFHVEKKAIRLLAIEMYKTCLNNRPELITRKIIQILSSLFSDLEDDIREAAIECYGFYLNEYPQLVDNELLDNITILFSSSGIRNYQRKGKSSEWVAFLAYRSFLESHPELFNPEKLKKIAILFQKGESLVQHAAFETYIYYLSLKPELINKEILDRIPLLFTSYDGDFLFKVLCVYSSFQERYPAFINSNILEKLPSHFEKLSEFCFSAFSKADLQKLVEDLKRKFQTHEKAEQDQDWDLLEITKKIENGDYQKIVGFFTNIIEIYPSPKKLKVLEILIKICAEGVVLPKKTSGGYVYRWGDILHITEKIFEQFPSVVQQIDAEKLLSLFNHLNPLNNTTDSTINKILNQNKGIYNDYKHKLACMIKEYIQKNDQTGEWQTQIENLIHNLGEYHLPLEYFAQNNLNIFPYAVNSFRRFNSYYLDYFLRDFLEKTPNLFKKDEFNLIFRLITNGTFGSFLDEKHNYNQKTGGLLLLILENAPLFFTPKEFSKLYALFTQCNQLSWIEALNCLQSIMELTLYPTISVRLDKKLSNQLSFGRAFDPLESIMYPRPYPLENVSLDKLLKFLSDPDPFVIQLTLIALKTVLLKDPHLIEQSEFHNLIKTAILLKKTHEASSKTLSIILRNIPISLKEELFDKVFTMLSNDTGSNALISLIENSPKSFQKGAITKLISGLSNPDMNIVDTISKIIENLHSRKIYELELSDLGKSDLEKINTNLINKSFNPGLSYHYLMIFKHVPHYCDLTILKNYIKYLENQRITQWQEIFDIITSLFENAFTRSTLSIKETYTSVFRELFLEYKIPMQIVYSRIVKTNPNLADSLKPDTLKLDTEDEKIFF